MVGSFVSATGSWIQSVALGWLVLDLGDSAFLLGLVGPSIGGLLLATFGTAFCFGVSAVASLGVAAACLAIRLPPYPKRDPGPWLPALGHGLRYAAQEVEVRRLLIVTSGLGLFAL